MCEIYGIVDFSGAAVDPSLLKAICRVTVHRGPVDVDPAPAADQLKEDMV